MVADVRVSTFGLMMKLNDLIHFFTMKIIK